MSQLTHLLRRLGIQQYKYPRPSKGTSAGGLVETTRDGFIYLSPPGDFSTIAIQHPAGYETYVLSPLLEDARQARNAIDLGAHIGLIAIPLAATISGTLFCFEMNRRTAKILLANARRNKLDNVRVLPVAVGDELDSLVVAMTRGTTLNVADQTAAPEALFDEMTDIIPVISLDQHFLNGPPIDIVKIDVDGWDYQALSGAKGMIDRWHPVIYAEYSAHFINRTTGMPGEAYLRILTDMGYRATILGPFVPAGPAPTVDPSELATFIAGLLEPLAHTGQHHVDIRWHRAA